MVSDTEVVKALGVVIAVFVKASEEPLDDVNPEDRAGFVEMYRDDALCYADILSLVIQQEPQKAIEMQRNLDTAPRNAISYDDDYCKVLQEYFRR